MKSNVQHTSNGTHSGETKQSIDLWRHFTKVLVSLSACIGLVLSFAVLSVWASSLWKEPTLASDFVTYYIAGNLLLNGQSPYDQSAQIKLRTVTIGVKVPEGHETLYSYFYPPTFLLVLLPLCLLPLSLAGKFWGLLQFIGLIALCVLICRNMPSKNWIVAILLLPTWIPTIATLKFGQISIFLALGLWFFVTSIKTKPDFRIALSALVLFCKPQYLPLPFLLLLKTRNLRRVLSIILFGVVVIMLVSCVILGWESLLGYLVSLRMAVEQASGHNVWKTSTYSWLYFAGMAGNFGAATLLMLDGATIIFWLWILKRKGLVEGAAAIGVGAVLISPHVLIYDLLLWVCTLPAIFGRPHSIALTLVLGMFVTPWLAHSIIQRPWPAIVWGAIILLVLGLTESREVDHPQIVICD